MFKSIYEPQRLAPKEIAPTARTQIQSHRPITLFGVILNQLFFSSQGPALAGCLQKATSLALYSFSSISALGTEVFWRWSVRSYHGCLVFWGVFFGDILVAGREQRTASVLIAPPLSNPHQPSSIHLLVDLNLTSHEVEKRGNAGDR